MAAEANIKVLQDAILAFRNLDLKKSLKENLGDQSLTAQFSGRLQEVLRQLEKAERVSVKISDGMARILFQALTQVQNQLNSIRKADPAAFVQNRTQYISALNQTLEQVENALVPFIVLAQEEMLRQLLEPDQKELGTTKDALKQEVEQIIAGVKQEAEAILNSAKEQATAIHSTARNTASGVSLLGAQDQFATLIKSFKVGAVISGVVALISFVAFFSYAIYLLNHPPELKTYPSAIFAVAIRITVLGSLGAVVALALKIFRSNLHMLYHTLHRRQLTNAIPSFVDAARTDDQRDLIFAKLVESVSSFGTSGLIGTGDDTPNTSKIVIDALPRLFEKMSPKS